MMKHKAIWNKLESNPHPRNAIFFHEDSQNLECVLELLKTDILYINLTAVKLHPERINGLITLVSNMNQNSKRIILIAGNAIGVDPQYIDYLLEISHESNIKLVVVSFNTHEHKTIHSWMAVNGFGKYTGHNQAMKEFFKEEEEAPPLPSP